MDMQSLTVYFILTPGVLLLDYAGPAEALRMARDMGAPLVLHTCGPRPEVNTSLGTQLTGLEPLPEQLPPNSLVLITGNSHEREDYATPAAQQVVRWLQTAMQPDTRLASICSGALLLAMAGQLDGLRCTTHHSLIADLQALAPTAQVQADRIFVDAGRVLTSAGITTGIDLALYIVEQVAGAALAAFTRASMDNIDALSKQVRVAGVSVAQFQAMALVAEEAGVSSETLSLTDAAVASLDAAPITEVASRIRSVQPMPTDQVRAASTASSTTA